MSAYGRGMGVTSVVLAGRVKKPAVQPGTCRGRHAGSGPAFASVFQKKRENGRNPPDLRGKIVKKVSPCFFRQSFLTGEEGLGLADEAARYIFL